MFLQVKLRFELSHGFCPGGFVASQFGVQTTNLFGRFAALRFFQIELRLERGNLTGRLL